MKYICVIQETGALGYLAPSPKANNKRQEFGAVLQASFRVTAGGVTYYVVLGKPNLFIPVYQVVVLEEV